MTYNGNYTGYSVNTVDVLLWVLLTVGTVGFPIVVFTICCLKQQWKVKKLEQEYLYADPSKKKNLERGFLGPYAESKESLAIEINKKNIHLSPKIPEIIVQPYNPNNKVRFKDDQNQLPALQSNNNIPNNEEYFEDEQNNFENQPNDLRGLKNAVNYFGKNLANKKNQNFSNRSSDMSGPQQGQVLPQMNSYVQNPLQNQQEEYPNDSPSNNNIVYSQAQQVNQDPSTFSIASSNPQIGIQGTLSQTNNLNNVPENIYSQVIAPQNRSYNSNNQNFSNREQEIPQNNYNSNNNRDYYEDDQPVYMNTPYNDNNKY